MTNLFKYLTIYKCTDETKFFQKDAVSLVLPDNSQVYGSRDYMNKIMKESGYKSVKVVKNIYEVVGDPNGKLDRVHFDGIVACDDDLSFIYISSERAYANLLAIMKYLESKNAEIVAGDDKDLTKFEVVVKSNGFEYLIEFNLKNETMTVYQSYVVEEALLRPAVIMSAELGTEDPIADTLVDFVENGAVAPVILAYEGKCLNAVDASVLLKSAGLIKTSRRKLKLACDFSDENISQQLIDYIEAIVNTPKREKLQPQACFSANDLYKLITYVYLDKVQNALSDRDYKNSMTISSYLWLASHWWEDED